ncbi:MAG: META domain-containing protein [Bacteroidetes bacterium]|nr:MAG: META domain-containing protein [Bacteroidota bacterium]
MKLTFLFCIAAILFASCTSSKKTQAETMPLYNTKWLLKKIYTGDNIENVQTKAFIKFDKEKSSAGGNGSCNNFGSTASVSGSDINFKNVFSTKMYCEEVQKTENSFLGSLEKVNRFEVKGKTLLLYHDKEILVEFLAE